MLRHVRTLSGLLALMALTFAMAEGVRASVCLSMGGPSTSSVVSSFDEGRAPQSAGSSAPESGASHESQQDGAGCPFGPMGMAGACATAVVPAESVANHPFLPNAVLPLMSVERHREVLLVRDLFRPPRA